MDAVLGIDIAKAKFQVTLLLPDGKRRHKSCPNTVAGFAELATWLTRQRVRHVHACLEATGTYGEALATWLYDAGHVVSVVNPAIIHAYAGTQLARSKTDRLDADLIAAFTATQRPPAWAPPAPEIRQLQALVRRLDALQGMRTQEANRLAAGVTVAAVRASIETVLAQLDAQIAHVRHLIREHLDQHPGLRSQRDLLTTIPGIGMLAAAAVLSEIGANVTEYFPGAAHLASWAGRCPGNHESAGRRHSGKRRHGNQHLQHILVEATWAAVRHDGYLKALYHRHVMKWGGYRSPTAKKKAIIVAAHAILVIIWHVLAAGKPYDELGTDFFTRRLDPERETRRLIAKLEAPGHQVSLQPAA